MLGLKTLVLQPDFTPETIFPIKKVPVEVAIVNVLEGSWTCLQHYDRPVLTASRNDLMWPSIVVLKKMYKQYEDARLTNEALFYRDHGICQYCQKALTISTTTRDHVVPRCRGGPDEWENVVASCQSCNALKDDKQPVGIWKPKTRPYQPSMKELFEQMKDFPLEVDDLTWTDFIGPWRGEVKLSQRAKKVFGLEGVV
jgi:5-methylcytosine-specific restriction endonuclease McrA